MDVNTIAPGVKLQHTLSGHSDLILHIAWSKDGKFLASPSRDKTIRIWNAETGKISTILKGHAVKINSVAWSNDGTRLVSGCADGTLGLWNIGKQTSRLEVINKFETSIYDLAWSPDNTMLATACEDGKLRIWSFELKQIDTIDAHQQGVNSVAWSPNGKLLASASADRKIAIWEISNNKWQKSQTIDAHLHSINSIDWSSNGEFLVSAARKTVKVWNPTSLSQGPLQLIQAQPDDAGFIKSVTFSHDFQLLAAKCGSRDVPANNIVRIWSCNTWQLLASIPEPTTSKAANSIAFHPHLPILATQGEDDKVIRLWNLANLDNPKTKSTNKKKAVIIGIDKYKNLDSELKTCTADAQVVSEFLHKMGWDTTTILNEGATMEKLQNSLRQLFQPNYTENSDYTALFYFSGLGAGVEDYSWGPKVTADRKGDLVAYDSSLETLTSLSWLHELLQVS
jgi:WD40 repeat protein